MELKAAVLIPAFQAQATIERTLLSVPDQPWIQIIVLDDGSQPALQINTSFQHAQLTLLRNPINQGVSSAMLQASQHLDEAVEYLIELDADDQLVAGALEAMVALLDSNIDILPTDKSGGFQLNQKRFS
jgi:glycosyltransferase involved in cell wall biosynthesis